MTITLRHAQDKLLIIIIALLIANMRLAAQELNARVTINSEQIEASYRPRLETLRETLEEFINHQKWTDAQFRSNERIECTFAFIINEMTQTDRYSASLTVQSRRPVFNASYISPVLNWRDEEIAFSYTEGMNLTWNEYDASETDLLAVVAYYSYLIIGMDFDSFSAGGGAPYYQVAQNIVSQMQNGNIPGWKAYDKKNNRHAIISELTDTESSQYSTLLYKYHRDGLDAMVQSVDKGRAAITQTLPLLKDIKSGNIMSPLMTMFIAAKQDELVNIYSLAPKSEKLQIYDLLSDLYPTYSNQLQKIKEDPQ